ncbi:MAG: PqqD family protein [Caldilineaceae bacterium]
MALNLPKQINLSHEVLFQELDNESIMLNLRDDAYYRLDDVSTRFWQLFTELGEVEPVVAQMLAEYQVDEPRLRQDLATLLKQWVDASVVTVTH